MQMIVCDGMRRKHAQPGSLPDRVNNILWPLLPSSGNE